MVRVVSYRAQAPMWNPGTGLVQAWPATSQAERSPEVSKDSRRGWWSQEPKLQTTQQIYGTVGRET